MRGFTIFVDGYGDENNGASIYYQGSYYYEWGYVFKDTDLDGLFEINSTYEDVLQDPSSVLAFGSNSWYIGSVQPNTWGIAPHSLPYKGPE